MNRLSHQATRSPEESVAYSVGHRLYRTAWQICWIVLCAWTPAPFHRWRALVLRIAGARIHPTAHIYGSARIWYPPNLIMEEHACLGPGVNCYCMAPIHLGHKTVVSQGAHLCSGTHDIDDANHQLIVRPIKLGNGAWVAAEAFIGPGVTIGDRAVIGARAVVFKDAQASGVYVGNPAQLIRLRKNPAEEAGHD